MVNCNPMFFTALKNTLPPTGDRVFYNFFYWGLMV